MKLSLEQIRNCANGCARVVSDNGKIKLLRFTEDQEILYSHSGPSRGYKKTFCTAGVKLEFVTNSHTLGLKVDVSEGSSRTFFCHDVFVNGEKRFELRGDVADYTNGHAVLEGSYALGSGKKKVCIYFPWSVSSEIISVELDNGATVAPVTYKRKILIFGDSITQGYDATFPSESYASMLTDALDAKSCNKGIGGEIFRPELATLPDPYSPDVITVAYGTNDWSGADKQTFDKNSELFFANLSALYPNAKIFALAPTWRGKLDQRTSAVGEFSYVAEKLSAIADSLPNVTFINCIDFIPHSPEMFSPDILHPNSLGFEHYGKNLIQTIKTELGIE